MKLEQALQQPDDTRLDLDGVIITRAEMKTSAKGSTYHSGTIVDGDTKAYISFFGDYPGILNEPVTITKAQISSYNGKRNFTAGKFSKVAKFNGNVTTAAIAPKPNRDEHLNNLTSPAQQQAKPQNNEGPVMGMCFKLAADHLRAQLLEPTMPALAKWTMFYKKAYSDVCLFNSPSAPVTAPTSTEEVPF